MPGEYDYHDEPTTSHLLAHGQNRNQYTGSEPTMNLRDHYTQIHKAIAALKVENQGQEPSTPKPQPHVHERFKLIYSDDMREVVARICEDCQYADTEDYWRGWEARGVKDATA